MSIYSSVKTYNRVSRNEVLKTVSSQPILGRENDMSLNEAGSYTFNADNWKRLNRFLILGTTGGSYYINEEKLTDQNIDVVHKCLTENPIRVVDTILDISNNNRAFKQDPSLLVLALAASVGGKTPSQDQIKARKYALSKLNNIARTSTQLFHFVDYVRNQRGDGRSLTNALAAWYTEKPLSALALQSWKYKSRDGYTHKDILRLAHPKTPDVYRNQIFKYMTKKWNPLTEDISLEYNEEKYRALAQITAAEHLLHVHENDKDAIKNIISYIENFKLTREAVPTWALNNKEVWEALLQDMPLTALLRNLNKLTQVGLISNTGNYLKYVTNRITDKDLLVKHSIHPIQIFTTLKQYASGHGQSFVGKTNINVWTPVQKLISALDDAFYLTLDTQGIIDNDILVAIDVSGSMSGGWNNSNNFTPLEGASAMALALLKKFNGVEIMAFDNKIHKINIHDKMRMDDVLKVISAFRGGGTNCNLPFEYATQNRLKVDGIISLTDNCTWANEYHTQQAWAIYKKTNGNAKAINVQMVPNRASTLDPEDLNTMEVVGFDANILNLITGFITGEI